ncbi:hypothetical protein F5Y02DRAFT_424468 [Annulohypoxylon stygium]|nr:hypothetical protein F5Y02DRAFT_424468 [Annulohypoxylon stygium]
MINPPTKRERAHSAATLPTNTPPTSAYRRIKPRTTMDLETYQYATSRRVLTIQSESRLYSSRNSNMVGRALHYQGIRSMTPLVAFINAARDYDQELLDMRFQLAGPNALAYLPDAPLKAAVESLERAHAILVGGAWRVRKCEDLWTQHSLQPYTGYERWDDELGGYVDLSKQPLELACLHFWQRAQVGFDEVIHELKKEANRLQRVVGTLEKCREMPFLRSRRERGMQIVRYNRPSLSSSNTSVTTPTLSFSSSSNVMMSGALPVNNANANNKGNGGSGGGGAKKWLGKLKSKLKTTPLGLDLAYISFKAEYYALRARDKLRGPMKPKDSWKMWKAFKEKINNQPGPTSFDLAMLGIKVDTELLIAYNNFKDMRDKRRAEAQRQSEVQAGGVVEARVE